MLTQAISKSPKPRRNALIWAPLVIVLAVTALAAMGRGFSGAAHANATATSVINVNGNVGLDAQINDLCGANPYTFTLPGMSAGGGDDPGATPCAITFGTNGGSTSVLSVAAGSSPAFKSGANSFADAPTGAGCTLSGTVPAGDFGMIVTAVGGTPVAAINAGWCSGSTGKVGGLNMGGQNICSTTGGSPATASCTVNFEAHPGASQAAGAYTAAVTFTNTSS